MISCAGCHSHTSIQKQNNLLIPFQTAVGPRKLDWLIHEKSDQVIKAMYDNGCTVKLLPGSQIGLIQVLGDHEVSIRRTMKQIIKLVSPSTRIILSHP